MDKHGSNSVVAIITNIHNNIPREVRYYDTYSQAFNYITWLSQLHSDIKATIKPNDINDENIINNNTNY
jgi:hypothetical protein